eukprot:3657066-Amphidinium_carterae.1
MVLSVGYLNVFGLFLSHKLVQASLAWGGVLMPSNALAVFAGLRCSHICFVFEVCVAYVTLKVSKLTTSNTRKRQSTFGVAKLQTPCSPNPQNGEKINTSHSKSTFE